ncbi:MarR family winged helix-turn-helix transcriptional regulator [Sphingomonas alpina]|uniref:Winged helix-turn-helix transcriptional regulator n=1 Tax=Sphingomonas alpina TaxID=653931 RepID=A0A7H0LG65_9SPHN|nr:MarR family winged helix-turn-helix transcriptional regulator [Sphingomonas alpina]QNQ08668.1 winged helix-turn-helix transcriptional regulator [Sphingomonas alpina]
MFVGLIIFPFSPVLFRSKQDGRETCICKFYSFAEGEWTRLSGEKGDNDLAIDNRLLGDPGTPAFRLDQYPFYLLNRAVSRYNIIIDARLRSIGIDIPTWRVLMVLGERSPRSIGQIAEAAVINLSTMMRIVQRMTNAGLVSNAPNAADARVTDVRLTPMGEDILDKARRLTAPIYAKLIAGFSARDFGRLIVLLTRLDANLDGIPRDTTDGDANAPA